MNSIKKILLVLITASALAAAPNLRAADNDNDLNSHDTVGGALVADGVTSGAGNILVTAGAGNSLNTTCPSSEVAKGQTTGSPVIITNGAFVWSTADIALKGRPNLSLIRHFNSYDARDGIFGKGWTTRCEKSLTRVIEYEQSDTGVSEPKLTYIYRTAIGRRYDFVESTNNNFLSPDGLQDVSLTLNSDGTVALTDQANNTERYNNLGQLVAEIDRNGNAVNYSYQNGALARMADSNGRYLQFTFDSSGHVSTVTDHTGRVWQYAYNSEGTLASVTDPMGGVMRYSYVPISRPADAQQYYAISQITDTAGVAIINVTYADDGRVATYTEGENTYTYNFRSRDGYHYKTDSMDFTWWYKLDEMGNKVEVWTPSSTRYADLFEYNQDAQLVKYTDKAQTEFSFEYDLLGRATGATTPDGTTRYSYVDNTNWLASVTSVSGRTVALSYDAKGNVSQVTDPAGNSAKYNWSTNGDLLTATDPLDNVVTQEVNSVGQPLKVTDPLGRSTTFAYDNRGNLVSVTNAQGDSTTLEYDLLDRLVRSTNALGHITQNSYDSAGRLLQVTDPAGGTTQFAYDTFGRVVSETRADGSVYSYTYRTDNLLATSTDPRDIVTQYNYDRSKRLTSSRAGRDTYSYAYDIQDRLTRATGGVTVSMSYDAMHRLLTETQGSTTTAYQYNNEGELVGMDAVGESLAYTYDNRGLLNSWTTPAGTHRYTHDPAGRLIGHTYPVGDVATMSFDAASQLLQQDYSQLGGPDLQYSYDTLGRMSTVKGKGNADWNYRYDAISRLIGATHEQDYSYSYDTLGNRLDNGGVYDIFNKLLENNDYSYTYDEAGSLINRVNKTTGEEMRLSYNGFGRQSAVEIAPAVGAAAATNASYVYDAFGRRVSKTVDRARTDFRWQGNNLLAEYEGISNTALYRYDGGYAAAEFVAAGGESNQVLSDYLGNPETLVSSVGTSVWHSGFEPFGAAVSANNSNLFEFNQRSPGQYFDAETGLSYNTHRFYDVNTGRYIRSDPIGIHGGLNSYIYADGNPVMKIDPYGLQSIHGKPSDSCFKQKRNFHDKVTDPIGSGRRMEGAIRTSSGNMACSDVMGSQYKAGDNLISGGEVGVPFFGDATSARSLGKNIVKSSRAAVLEFSFWCKEVYREKWTPSVDWLKNSVSDILEAESE